MVTGKDIVAEARTWVDTPFSHQASLKGVGCDCGGLVRGVGVGVGLLPPDYEKSPDAKQFLGYGREPTGGRMTLACSLFLNQEIGPGEGFVVLMRWFTEPQHCGILTGEGTIIHGYESVGKVVEHSYKGPWVKRTASFWSFRGVSNV